AGSPGRPRDGTQVLFLSFISRTASRTPSSDPITRAARAPRGRASAPWERIVAKPDHFTEMGELRPFSPMPYWSRRTGYIQDTAAAPTGVASSCMYVRYRGEAPTMSPAL